MSTTTDHLLGGRVEISQHRKGYRVAIDPVFLAAAVPARDGDRVLELGCGSGAAALCLAWRVRGVHVTGLELQAEMLDLARHNVDANECDDAISIMDGDVASPPVDLEPGSFDHVMTNPPYMAAGRGNPPPDPVKAVAMVESHVPLAGWIKTAHGMLESGGSFTMVHRADRAGEITGLMEPYFGSICICPLWPGPDGSVPAKRILVQGMKGASAETRTTDGVILHDNAGVYTEAADQVLRGGQSLIL
jgi:tRNA1(Val) A37 N6-methylase TrmN6